MPFIRNTRLVEVNLGSVWEPVPDVEAFEWRLLNSMSRPQPTDLPRQGQFRILGSLRMFDADFPDKLFQSLTFGQRVEASLRVTYSVGSHAWRRRTFRPVLFCTDPGALIQTVQTPTPDDQTPSVTVPWETAAPEFPDPGEPATSFMSLEVLLEDLQTGLLTPETE